MMGVLVGSTRMVAAGGGGGGADGPMMFLELFDVTVDVAVSVEDRPMMFLESSRMVAAGGGRGSAEDRGKDAPILFDRPKRDRPKLDRPSDGKDASSWCAIDCLASLSFSLVFLESEGSTGETIDPVLSDGNDASVFMEKNSVNCLIFIGGSFACFLFGLLRFVMVLQYVDCAEGERNVLKKKCAVRLCVEPKK